MISNSKAQGQFAPVLLCRFRGSKLLLANASFISQENGISAMPFHAGLCKNRKRAAFEAFIGKLF